MRSNAFPLRRPSDERARFVYQRRWGGRGGRGGRGRFHSEVSSPCSLTDIGYVSNSLLATIEYAGKFSKCSVLKIHRGNVAYLTAFSSSVLRFLFWAWLYSGVHLHIEMYVLHRRHYLL